MGCLARDRLNCKMKAYSFVEDICKERFDFKIGKEIGYGAQGQVFEIEECPTRVIKISILYDVDPHLDLDIVFEKIQAVYEYVCSHQENNLGKIYEFGRLRTGSRPTANGPQDYIVYYSIQEKLASLSDDEKKVFKTICQALNDELELERTVEDIVKELSKWLKFDSEKTIKFYYSLGDLPFEHNDLRRQNILKDVNGNFRLIDFDLAEFV